MEHFSSWRRRCNRVSKKTSIFSKTLYKFFSKTLFIIFSYINCFFTRNGFSVAPFSIIVSIGRKWFSIYIGKRYRIEFIKGFRVNGNSSHYYPETPHYSYRKSECTPVAFLSHGFYMFSYYRKTGGRGIVPGVHSRYYLLHEEEEGFHLYNQNI